MQEREDRSAAEAKAAEEKGALMARIPAVSRGAARSAEQSAQPAGMMVDVEVAAITDELPRGPKTCPRLVYDEPNHRRAANKRRKKLSSLAAPARLAACERWRASDTRWGRQESGESLKLRGHP